MDHDLLKAIEVPFLKTVRANDVRLLTPEELAERLKVPKSWIYEQSRLGNIPTHRIGKYIRFKLDEVLNALKKGDS